MSYLSRVDIFHVSVRIDANTQGIIILGIEIKHDLKLFLSIFKHKTKTSERCVAIRIQ